MSNALQLDRRSLLKSLLCATGVAALGPCAPLASANDESHYQLLPSWTEGHFDIHHIDTGRGNSALLIFPDGTTMLIDAGAAGDSAPAGTLAPAHPNSSRRPGEWQARYILAHAPRRTLDYFLATHIHPDHVSGLADVAAQLSIGVCIDRAFPHYAAAQQPANAPFARDYLAFLHNRIQQGQRIESAKVGSTTQIRLQHQPARYPTFRARILSANGNTWNPKTRAVDAHSTHQPADSENTNENLFSVATRFEYGRFSYFTGGDLTFDTEDGRAPELDIETPVVRAAGRTEVAVADHHGYFDACGPSFANTLDAQVYIIPAWDIGHPGSAQMQRMLGAWDSNGSKATHDVFSTDLLPVNALLNRRFASQLKSQQGHIVLRVTPGGDTYKIFTLDSTVEDSPVTGIFGPYQCRA